MRSRIAPMDTRPVHDLEIGYLRELTIAIKVKFYDLTEHRQYTQELTHELLARWVIEYRHGLTRCNGYRGGIPRFDGHSAHEKEIQQIDTIIDKLKAGLNAQQPTRDITLEDIETLEKAYRALDVCKEQLIWY